jgi:two-component system sensor histidine kinase KdpD
MVAVRADRSQENLLREGARLAQRLQADWVVVHVDRPNKDQDQRAREVLLNIAMTAESLGAEFANVPGEDVAETLLDHVRTRNATKLVMGHRAGYRTLPWRPSLAQRIARSNPDIGLILLKAGDGDYDGQQSRGESDKGDYTRPLVLATVACGLTTLVAGWLLHIFDLTNVVVLFLLTVVLVALKFGRIAGIWGALLCVACLDFFFVEPRLSFAVSDTQYIFSFGLMLVVALVTSQLASRLRSEAKIATAGERRAAAVARVARDLSGAIKIEQIVRICSETIAPLFNAQAAMVLPDHSGRLLAARQAPFVDISVAQWSYDHMQPAGLGTQTLNAAAALYLPLKAPMAPRGVLALHPMGDKLAADPDDQRLLGACCSSIALALERIHFVEVAQDTLVRMEGERLRNALLAAVSHDLKTPLTAIRGLAETLEHPAGIGSAEHIALARSIRMQSEELQRLVSNLLDLARMQSEGVHLNKEWQSLSEIVGSALARLPSRTDRLRMRAELGPDLPLIEVDAALIERVLVNLIDNALKYAGADATITIRAQASGEAMQLFVEDNGPGLPNVDPDSLFEAFTRGRKESAIAGVGLGLALCRSIVAAHAGTIHASQRRPQGACFEIRLPLGSPPEIEHEITK